MDNDKSLLARVEDLELKDHTRELHLRRLEDAIARIDAAAQHGELVCPDCGVLICPVGWV